MIESTSFNLQNMNPYREDDKLEKLERDLNVIRKDHESLREEIKNHCKSVDQNKEIKNPDNVNPNNISKPISISIGFLILTLILFFVESFASQKNELVHPNECQDTVLPARNFEISCPPGSDLKRVDHYFTCICRRGSSSVIDSGTDSD